MRNKSLFYFGKVILMVTIFFIPGKVLAQLTSEIENKFQDFASHSLQEKIYVHLNRTDHIVGEIIWFKVYCVDGTLHQSLDLSSIAYIEVLNSNNQPVLQTKVALKNGEGTGSLYVPATITTGNYLFRAYTHWMKNNPVQYFFNKKINIINTLKPGELCETKPNATLYARFFPEGGYLIEGIKTKIGFKVIDQNGYGLDCTGVLVNHSNDTLVKFKTNKFGMGSFDYTPIATEQCRVTFTRNRISEKFNLPEIKKSGYGLRVSESQEGILNVQVANTDKSFSAYLFVHTRQSIKISEVKSTGSFKAAHF